MKNLRSSATVPSSRGRQVDTVRVCEPAQEEDNEARPGRARGPLLTPHPWHWPSHHYNACSGDSLTSDADGQGSSLGHRLETNQAEIQISALPVNTCVPRLSFFTSLSLIPI